MAFDGKQGLNKTRTMEMKTYTPEQLDAVFEAIHEHNEREYSNGPRWASYIIRVSGEHKRYFTLWQENYREATFGGIRTFFIKNLTADITAIPELLKRMTGMPVELYGDKNADPRFKGFKSQVEGIPTIPFGKYRGRLIEDIFNEDPKWVLWFLKEYKTKPVEVRWSREKQYLNLTDNEQRLKEQAEQLVKLFFERKAEENRETCTSRHFGTLKKRLTLEATATFVKRVQDADPEYDIPEKYKADMVTDDGNLFYIYTKEPMERGLRYKVTGTVTDHKEIVGRKKTYLNRVKVEAI